MNALKLSPVYFSALLMAAHFFRLGLDSIVVICICFPFLLLFKTKWAARIVQIMLFIGALEWTRFLYQMADERIKQGEPWVRLVIILGIAALFTGFSAFVFAIRSIKERYKL
ncbi:MAG: hypothetical protein HXX09_13985 [Bacteroidetes bacterium]|nr:hypothetical protein [Bacteroidota bacterium]